MASSLFGGSASSPQSFVNSLKSMIGDPDAAMGQMMRTNPQFAEFVRKNRGKTADQIAADYGVDIGPFRKYM